MTGAGIERAVSGVAVSYGNRYAIEADSSKPEYTTIELITYFLLRCCKLHDECYENIYCPFYTVYFQPYFWKCYHGQPLCALENFDSQYDFVNGCAGRLCECDR